MFQPTQAAHQRILDESLGRQRCQPRIEGQHYALVNAAAHQLGQLVAQRCNARGRQRRFAGERGEIVAWMRLKAHHTTGHAAVLCLVFKQRQHGLVAAVHAVEVANR